MATNAALGASGVSFALGVMNARNLNSLTEEVEKMKKSMAAPKEETADIDNPDLDFDLEKDLAEIESPSDVNRKSIADVVTRVQKLEDGSDEVANASKSFSGLESTVKSLNSNFIALDADVQNTLFDVETVVNLEPDIQDLLKNWKVLGTKAFVNEKFRFHANDCKLGLIKNLGDESAIHFAGASDPNWSMYMAAPIGKSTDGKAPPSHAGVTGSALRMRVGGAATDGFIVENANHQGVFSVRSDGKTTMGSVASGNLDGNTVGVSHSNHHTLTNFAVSQNKDGTTRVNAADGRNITLGNNGSTKVVVEGSANRSLTIKNTSGTSDTHFNHEGNNYIRCASGKATVFRVGTNATNKLFVNKEGTHVNGLFEVDGVNVNSVVKTVPGQVTSLVQKLEALTTRVQTIESNYIDSRRRVHLRNHVANKYLSSDGNVTSSKSSSHSRYEIEH